MRLNEITFSDAVPVDSYGPGFFRVSGEVVQGTLCLGPTGIADWEGYDDLGPLLAMAAEIDVLFVGTGVETAHIPPAMRRKLEEAGIGVEVMNSPSACRTYNVLLSEGRRIAIAALPV